MEIIIPIFVLGFFYFFFKSFWSTSSLHNKLFKHVEKGLALQEQQRVAQLKKQQDYNCNHCHAVLQSPDDISPSGDVKCHHCNQWFNVYQ